MRPRWLTLLLVWLATDLILFVASYTVAYFLKVGWILSTDLPFRHFILLVTAVSPLWLIALLTTRTFGLTRSQATLRNFSYILYSCIVGTALVALSYYFVYLQIFSRMILLLGFLISSIVLWLWHIMMERFVRSQLRKDPATFPTLVIGVTRESKKLLALLQERKSPLRPVAILDASGCKETAIAGVPVLGKLNKLEETLTRLAITHLIQCSDLEQSINLLGACRSHGITYLLLPSVLGIVERDERIESLEGRPVTMVSPPQTWWQWFFH